MKIAAAIFATILIATSAPSTASEGDFQRLEKQISASTFKLIKEDPKTSPLPEEQVKIYSSIVAKQTVSCFQEKAHKASAADLTTFEAAITTYDNIYRINDWRTFVRDWIEKDSGLKWKDWFCDEDHPPTSPSCKAVKSYFEVSMGLYPVLFKCLADSLADAKSLAVLN